MMMDKHVDDKNGQTVVFGKTPDEWIKHTEYLVKEGLEVGFVKGPIFHEIL